MPVSTDTILYSFRRCPYAMRARMALHYTGLLSKLTKIEVDFKNKPEELLAISPKGTVPVLHLSDGTVIDESIEIMRFALTLCDPDNWLEGRNAAEQQQILALISENDTRFKRHLDHYKYHVRFPEHSQEYYQQQGQEFLGRLNQAVDQNGFVSSTQPSLADIAVFPFIRQWNNVDKTNLDDFPQLAKWLNNFVTSSRFTDIMQKN